MRTWEDVSTYSRGDKERVPSSWCWKGRAIGRVLIHRHIYDPERWHLSCGALGISALPLDARDLEAAKSEALKHLTDLCHSYLEALETQ